jgi:hypothetical protein
MPRKKIIPREDFKPSTVNYKQYRTPEPGSQEETAKSQEMNQKTKLRETKGEPMTSKEGVEFHKTSPIAKLQKQNTKKKKKQLVKY